MLQLLFSMIIQTTQIVFHQLPVLVLPVLRFQRLIIIIKKVRRFNVASTYTIRCIDKNRSELITQAICNMIYEDMLPINTVEHSG